MNDLSVDEVALIHARLIERITGDPGLLDLRRLESAVARPQATFAGDDLYPSVWDKAAALMLSLVRNHPFIDKGERTALVATGLFLERNGYTLTATNDEAYALMVEVALGRRDRDTVAAWLREHMRPTS